MCFQLPANPLSHRQEQNFSPGSCHTPCPGTKVPSRHSCHLPLILPLICPLFPSQAFAGIYLPSRNTNSLFLIAAKHVLSLHPPGLQPREIPQLWPFSFLDSEPQARGQWSGPLPRASPEFPYSRPPVCQQPFSLHCLLLISLLQTCSQGFLSPLLSLSYSLSSHILPPGPLLGPKLSVFGLFSSNIRFLKQCIYVEKAPSPSQTGLCFDAYRYIYDRNTYTIYVHIYL